LFIPAAPRRIPNHGRDVALADPHANGKASGHGIACHGQNFGGYSLPPTPAAAYRSAKPKGYNAMETFTPLSATIGGLLIGLSATLLWLVNGRTAGISNIAGGMYPVRQGDVLWRVLFLIGLPVGGWIGYAVGPVLLSEIPATVPVIDLPVLWLVGAGLLVGVGTRVGRGCTSGHGVCGLSRFSVRSVVAVAIFMATAAITVFVVRHVI
jgi:uncharacterized protein